MDFVVFPPRHGRSVTDWGWGTHEARLRCPDDVSGDMGGCSVRRVLKPKFYWPTQTMVAAGILPFRENSHGRAGNRTRYLVISSQIVWLVLLCYTVLHCSVLFSKTYGVYFQCQNECKYFSKIFYFLFFPGLIWRCCKGCRNCLLNFPPNRHVSCKFSLSSFG